MSSSMQFATVYLHLSPEMQRSLPRGIEQLIEDEDIELPAQVTLTRTSMPVEAGAPIAKDVAIGINIALDLTLDAQSLAVLIGTVSASVATLILAVSQALKNRGHTPRVVEVDEVIPVQQEDGSTVMQVAAVRKFVAPGPQLRAELNARLGAGQGVAIDFEVDT